MAAVGWIIAAYLGGIVTALLVLYFRKTFLKWFNGLLEEP